MILTRSKLQEHIERDENGEFFPIEFDQWIFFNDEVRFVMTSVSSRYGAIFDIEKHETHYIREKQRMISRKESTDGWSEHEEINPIFLIWASRKNGKRFDWYVYAIILEYECQSSWHHQHEWTSGVTNIQLTVTSSDESETFTLIHNRYARQYIPKRHISNDLHV